MEGARVYAENALLWSTGTGGGKILPCGKRRDVFIIPLFSILLNRITQWSLFVFLVVGPKSAPSTTWW
jgi:hypothetical protein